MRLIIDNSNLIVGGGIQVATSFIYDLKSLNLDHEYHIIQSSNSLKAVNESLFPDNFTFYNLTHQETHSISKRRKKVKNIERNVTPDCIFVTFGPSYHKSKFPKVVGFAIGHILYPNSIFYKNISIKELFYIKTRNFIKDFLFRRNSDALIFETEDARIIYNHMINSSKPTYTVSNTINEIFLNEDKWKKIKVNKTDCDILYLTANYTHKNIQIIPKVIDQLVEKAPHFNFCFHLSLSKEELSFSDKYDSYINYLGKVHINSIPSLYAQIDILFMPTLLEIFSASYLEAMFMNIPIVASDESFSRDICRDAAVYCKSIDPISYSNAILELFNNNILREKLINNGMRNLERFGNSIKRTTKYLEIIEKTIK